MPGKHCYVNRVKHWSAQVVCHSLASGGDGTRRVIFLSSPAERSGWEVLPRGPAERSCWQVLLGSPAERSGWEVLLNSHAVVLLCSYVVMLFYCYVVRLFCCYAVVLLCCSVVRLLCYSVVPLSLTLEFKNTLAPNNITTWQQNYRIT